MSKVGLATTITGVAVRAKAGAYHVFARGPNREFRLKLFSCMADAAQPVGQPERVPAGHFVFVGIVCLFWAVTGIGALQTAYHHDFLNLYTGSSLAREGRFAELYDIDTQLSRERELLGEVSELVPFVRPHFYAFLLAPISLLPYDAAFWSWIVLQTLLLVGCWMWARKRFGPDALIFCCLYFPTVGGILVGQDCVFLTVIFIVASGFAEREKDFWSGAVLGLALFKFHLLLLLPIAMVLHRKWRMFGGFLASGAVAALLSPVLGGLAGVEQYIRLLQADELTELAPAPQNMINIYALGANFGLDHVALNAFLALVVVGLAAVAIWRAPLWRWPGAAIAGSILVAPHVYAYDAGILLLPLLLVEFRSPYNFSKFAVTTFLTPLPFLTLVIGPPYTFIPSAALLLVLVALASENYREGFGPTTSLSSGKLRDRVLSRLDR